MHYIGFMVITGVVMKTEDRFQRTTRRYIPEDIVLELYISLNSLHRKPTNKISRQPDHFLQITGKVYKTKHGFINCGGLFGNIGTHTAK
jgi:hypothetical protein